MSRRLKAFPVQLGLVALLGWVVRVWGVLAWYGHLAPEGDQVFYWRQAQDLARGYGFVFRNNFGERVPTSVHPPLHSAYLAIVGLLHFPEDAVVPYRVACTFLGAATVVFIGLAARKVAGNRAGLVAALLAAVYPNLWLNDVMMLSESMFALTTALVLFAAACFGRERSTANAVFVGVTVALAALTRVEAELLFAFLVLPLMLWARDVPWKERFRTAAVAIGVGAALVAPWIVRNALTFEKHPLTISTSTGFVLEVGNCDETYGLAPPKDGQGNPGPPEETDKLLGYWWPMCDRTPWPAGDETVVGAAKQKTAVDYMSTHKSRLPVVVLARIGRMWDVYRPGQSYDFNLFFERRGDYPTRVAMAMYYPILVAAIAGLVVLRRRRQTLAPYLAVFAATTVTAAISFGITRYRVGAEVPLVVLAGVTVDAALRRWWHPARGTGPAVAAAPGEGARPDDVLVATTSGEAE